MILAFGSSNFVDCKIYSANASRI